MSSAVAARPVHLLTDGGARCGGAAVYVTSNPAAVTCDACRASPVDETEPTEIEVDVAVPVRTPDQLRAWRAAHSLTQRKLAAKLDVQHMTVYRWERGTSPIPRVVELALNYLDLQDPVLS